jgi:RNA polymerase sigma-70 factor (ECF subfamily)
MSENKLQKEFGQFYESLSDAIFRHCFFRLSDRERALDLMQETFIRTWSVLADGKREIKNIKSFLYRTAHNLIVDEYRTRKSTFSVEGLRESGWDIKDEDKIEVDVETSIETEKILQTLNKIDEKYRDAVIMRYIDELSLKEIAEATGETINNIGVRINRGLKQTKKLLENEG